jgi:hypothetical protein
MLLRAIGELLAGNETVDDGRLISVLSGRESTGWLNVESVRKEPAWQALRYSVSYNYNHGLSKWERVE